MPKAVIVDAVRTAIGKRKGALRNAHPVDLGAAVLKGLIDRNGLDPALVDDVLLGVSFRLVNSPPILLAGPRSQLAYLSLFLGQRSTERAGPRNRQLFSHLHLLRQGITTLRSLGESRA